MSFSLATSDSPYDISLLHVKCLSSDHWEKPVISSFRHQSSPCSYWSFANPILSPAIIQRILINMTNRSKRVERVGRWYDGSVASAGAACFTHPLDLLKVHLQERTWPQSPSAILFCFPILWNPTSRQIFTHLFFVKTTENVKIGMVRRAVGIFRSQGVLAIYNGISASLLRQLLLNTRFTIYEERPQLVLERFLKNRNCEPRFL